MQFTSIVFFYLVLANVATVLLTEEDLLEDFVAKQGDYRTEPEKSLERLNKLLKVAKENNWQKLENACASEKALALLSLGRALEAEQLAHDYFDDQARIISDGVKFKFLQILLRVADFKQDKEQSKYYRDIIIASPLIKDNAMLQAHAYQTISQSFLVYELQRDALVYAQKSLARFEEIEDKQAISSSFITIAAIYHQLEEYEKAIEHFEIALKMAENSGSTFVKAIIVFNIGAAHWRLKNREKGRKYLNEALALSQQLKDEVGVAYTSRLLGEIEAQQTPDSAEKYFNTAIELFDKHGLTAMAIVSRISKLEMLTTHQLYKEGEQVISELEETIENAPKITNRINYKHALYEFHKKQGNTNQALTSLEQYTALIEAKHKQEKMESLDEMMIRFESDRKEAQNKLLVKANEVKELKLKEQAREKTIWRLSFAFALSLIVIFLFLIAKQKEINIKMKALALRDELTGAPNRRAVLQHAREMVETHSGARGDLMIAILDIDHFKRFNDRYGHDMGDEVLKIVAEACRQVIRKEDYYGRYGGEEWMLVLTDVDTDEVEAIFKRLSDYLQENGIEDLPKNTAITFSMGAAKVDKSIEQEARRLESAIKSADSKMYEAKENGRNQLVC